MTRRDAGTRASPYSPRCRSSCRSRFTVRTQSTKLCGTTSTSQGVSTRVEARGLERGCKRVREHEREARAARRRERLGAEQVRATANDRLVERCDRELVQSDLVAVEHAARYEDEQRMPIESDGQLRVVAPVKVVGKSARARPSVSSLPALNAGRSAKLAIHAFGSAVVLDVLPAPVAATDCRTGSLARARLRQLAVQHAGAVERRAPRARAELQRSEQSTICLRCASRPCDSSAIRAWPWSCSAHVVRALLEAQAARRRSHAETR